MFATADPSNIPITSFTIRNCIANITMYYITIWKCIRLQYGNQRWS